MRQKGWLDIKISFNITIGCDLYFKPVFDSMRHNGVQAGYNSLCARNFSSGARRKGDRTAL